MLFVSIALLDAHTLPHTQAGRCPLQPQAAPVSQSLTYRPSSCALFRSGDNCWGEAECLHPKIRKSLQTIYTHEEKSPFPDLVSGGHLFVGGFLWPLYVFMALSLHCSLGVFLPSMKDASNLLFSPTKALNAQIFPARSHWTCTYLY